MYNGFETVIIVIVFGIILLFGNGCEDSGVLGGCLVRGVEELFLFFFEWFFKWEFNLEFKRVWKNFGDKFKVFKVEKRWSYRII